jgi:hypothetical protein
MSSRITQKLVKALDPKYVLDQDTMGEDIYETAERYRKRFIENTKDINESVEESELHKKPFVKRNVSVKESGLQKEPFIIKNPLAGKKNSGKSYMKSLKRGARSTRKFFGNTLGIGSKGTFKKKRNRYTSNVNPTIIKSRGNHISKLGTPNNIGYTGEKKTTIYQTNKFSGKNPLI